ncbi:MAG: alkaline phosphatase D family protein [Chloroflexota bacterium]|nr:alkaline phosphatase D family protein [Chloroflexota bacterium]
MSHPALKRFTCVLSVVILLVIAIRPAAAQSDTLPNGVASGDVTATSAVLWTRSTAPGTVTFEIAASDSFDPVLITAIVDVIDPLLPVKVDVTGLIPGSAYAYRATDAAGSTVTGRFSTPADVDAGSVGVRFGVTGDWRGELRPYPAVSNVASMQLDFFLMHGDTIYADYPSPAVPAEQATTIEEYRLKHEEVYGAAFGVNYWADVRASTPIFATIDDHEVTNDFAGGAPPSSDARFAGQDADYINQTPLFEMGLQAFHEYNPIRDQVYVETGDARMDGVPKLYRYQTYGTDAAIFVIDSRSFRDANIPTITPADALNPLRLIPYLAQYWTPDRTLVGRAQLDDLKRDLDAAHDAGVTWKFIMIPEPMQNMGWFGGNDRWEGYAPERLEIVQHIVDHAIDNVVFVSADVHTTFINNITYQTQSGGENLPTDMFEVTTGSVAFYPPTGAALVEGAIGFGLVNDEEAAAYAAADIDGKDAILADLFNRFVLRPQRYTELGLDDSTVNLVSQEGGDIIGHVFGWTAFEIAAQTQRLTITTYGIPAYDAETLASEGAAILERVPEVYSVLVLDPQS